MKYYVVYGKASTQPGAPLTQYLVMSTKFSNTPAKVLFFSNPSKPQ